MIPSPAPTPSSPEIERDPAGDALAGKLVAHDPERKGEDRAAEPLDRAGADHHR